RRRALWSSCPMRRPPPRSRLFPYTTLFRSLGALLVGAAEVERGLAWERAPARLHRDREVAAAHELGVTRRHDEAERRGRRERLGRREEAVDGAGERGRRHQPEEEQPEDRHRGSGRRAPGGTEVLDALERDRLDLAPEHPHGPVEQRRGRLRGAAVGEVEEAREAVGDGGVALPGAGGERVAVEARQDAEVAEDRAGDEGGEESERAEEEGDVEEQPRGGAHPEPGFERGPDAERGGQHAEREHEPEEQLGADDAPPRVPEPPAEGVEKLEAVLAHGRG